MPAGFTYELLHSANSGALPIAGSLSPSADNAVSYGTPARRPSQLFAATATIGTSDAREKTAIRQLTDSEYAVGMQLAREIGAYHWLEAIERKGDTARWHIGQTVQRAMAIFEQNGLDPFQYGAICYDMWVEEAVNHPAQYEQIEVPAVLDENGNELEPARHEQGALIKATWTEVTQEAGDRYSWRDTELLWLMMAATTRRQDEQDARMEALEQGSHTAEMLVRGSPGQLDYSTLTVAGLRQIAAERNISIPSGVNRAGIIDLLVRDNG